MSSDALRVVPLLQRQNFDKLMRSIEKEPDFDQLKETALKCYEERFFTRKSCSPLVIIAMHLKSSKLVRKFHEIDHESREYSLNELIMHVALQKIQSPEIRDYLFSQATKQDLSEPVLYATSDGKATSENTILYIADKKGDGDLIGRLRKKGIEKENTNNIFSFLEKEIKVF
ncbi:MAG: hypothetical protein K940chlam5_01471 [Candidatus Anoxychlamydiales bacterium]|nr:hypothetical protein [Candidatus Anoxychlamydiales bacterium]